VHAPAGQDAAADPDHLWKLFKPRRRIVYTAQQWATVEDVFDRVCAIIERVPSLKKRLAKPPSKKDNRGHRAEADAR
jgi:hypothetical protein